MEEQLNVLMHNMAIINQHSYALICKKYGEGLGQKDLLVLILLEKNGNVRMSELANKMDCPLSSMTSTIDKLVKQQYLIRYHSTEDRRAVVVDLGKKGKKIMANYNKHIKRRYDQMISNLTEIEKNQLSDVLHKLIL